MRERHATAIRLEWHPMAELGELLEVTEDLVGGGRGHASRLIGAAGARQNSVASTARSYFYLAQPEQAIRLIAGMWRQFNDAGEMKLVDIGERLASEKRSHQLSEFGFPKIGRAAHSAQYQGVLWHPQIARLGVVPVRQSTFVVLA